jgi:zinc D-Ala-D-Ala carboxypeptidase
MCANGPLQAGAQNAQSLTTLPLNLFGRAETGWAFYEPLVANEIGTECPAASPGFAKALAQWQSAHGMSAAGVMNALTLSSMSRLWQSRRPFVLASRQHCPDPPSEQSLARATVTESYGGKEIQLRPDALNAYRQLVAAARAAGVLRSSNLLAIFSAFRSSSYDAERCAREQNCNGVVRATCSAHRTAYAMDVYLGAAPGYMPDSSADANRLFISKSATYRWLVKNAARFGFVNYPFEPWHWEFVGTAVH